MLSWLDIFLYGLPPPCLLRPQAGLTALDYALLRGFGLEAVEAGLAMLGKLSTLSQLQPTILLRANVTASLACANPIRVALALAIVCARAEKKYPSLALRLKLRKELYIEEAKTRASHVSAGA